MGFLQRFGVPVACALMILCQPGSARATDMDPLAWRDAATLPALVETLETWLDGHSPWPRRTDKPSVKWIGAARAASMNDARSAADHGHARGFYDPGDTTIYLVRPWDRRDPFDVSVLLHELAHHRQETGGHWYCPGAQELPAYRLQQKWLARLGLEPDVNWIAIVMEAGCTPRDIHPD